MKIIKKFKDTSQKILFPVNAKLSTETSLSRISFITTKTSKNGAPASNKFLMNARMPASGLNL